MSEKFNVWILPYRNFRDKNNNRYKNDSPLVARQVKDSFNSPVAGAYTAQSYQVDVHIKGVSLNMESVKRAISRVTSTSDVHLVIGLGINTKIKNNPIIRFEKGASGAKLEDHYGRFGQRIQRNRDVNIHYEKPYEASWYTKRDRSTLESIQAHSIHDPTAIYDINGVSQRAGGYYCEYMSGEFAKAQQISDIGFFIHIADLERERDRNSVLCRQTEVDSIAQFIRDQLQIFDSKIKPAMKTGTSQ